MTAAEYWAKRARETMNAMQDAATKRIARIGKAMAAAQQTLTEEAEKILGNYMKRYNLTRQEALAELAKPSTRKEYDEIVAKVATMPDGDAKRMLLARASSGAYRFRIDRAEALRANIAIETAKVAQVIEEETTKQLKFTAIESYQRTMFAQQKLEGVAFAQPNLQAALAAVGERWFGGDYSQSIWKNRERLAEVLEEKITASYLSGKSYAKIAREIRDEFGVSFRDAERLVRTETCYVSTQAKLKSIRDAGYTHYFFLGSLDETSCEMCGSLDQKRFAVKDAKVGVNLPPMHPWCRCVIVPDCGETGGEFRRGRDAEGKNVLLPKDMNYEEWKRWQEAGCPKDVKAWRDSRQGLKEAAKDATISHDPKGAESASVHFVGKINREVYRCVTPDITTDDVVITEERVRHIFESHPQRNHAEMLAGLSETVASPDYILQDSHMEHKTDTAIVLKMFPGHDGGYRTILRLATSTDDGANKNSVITMFFISEKKWNKYLRNKTILYRRE